MKKLYTLLTAVVITASAFAQAPDKMSYQAVIRDASNALVTSQAVGMKISILQGGATGTTVYIETQTPTTNINGLVSVEIGSGTVVSGAFNTIDWSNGPYFIKTETDPIGGTTYTITGTSQLMSVPYALHANTADSLVGGTSIFVVDTFVVSPSDWVSLGSNAYKYTYTNVYITQNIVDIGTIQVSNKTALAPEWHGWPNVVAGGSGLRFNYSLNTINLIANNYTSGPPPIPYTIKLVILK